MTKQKLIYSSILILLISALGLHGWRIFQNWQTMSLQEELARGIVSQMSLSQKVGQLIHTGISGSKLRNQDLPLLTKIHVGGIILFKRNLTNNATIKKLTTNLQVKSVQSSGIPLMISIDQEGGRIQRIRSSNTSDLPSALTIGQTRDPENARLMAVITGAEMRDLGINLVLAPVLDINNNPANPVIGTRSFGSDKERVSHMGLSYTQGALEIRSGPVIKHFPGHGNTNIDSHKNLPIISSKYKDLRKNELIPFKRAINAGAPIVMVAHILFPDLDPDYPATLSRKIITGLLRKKMSFQGLVMTDALEMKAVADRYKQLEVAKLAIKAGADILLFGDPTPALITRVHATLVRAYKNKELDLVELDRSVKRQIRYKLRNAIFQDTRKVSGKLGNLENKLREYHMRTRFNPQDIVLNLLNNSQKKSNDIVHDICISSINSLKKPYLTSEPNNTHVYSTSNKWHKFSLENGITKDKFHIGGLPKLIKEFNFLTRISSKNISRIHSKKSPWKNQSLLVELNESNLRQWNHWILKSKTNTLVQSTRIVGLYTGNPYKKIYIPKNSEVLINPSKICSVELLQTSIPSVKKVIPLNQVFVP